MNYYTPEQVCTVSEALAAFGVDLPHDIPGWLMVPKEPPKFLTDGPEGRLFVRCSGMAIVGWQGLAKRDGKFRNGDYSPVGNSIYLVVDGDRLKVVHSA